jgi:hypothetical protein
MSVIGVRLTAAAVVLSLVPAQGGTGDGDTYVQAATDAAK